LENNSLWLGSENVGMIEFSALISRASHQVQI